MEDFGTVEVMLGSEFDWYEFFDNWWRNCCYPNWEAGYSKFIETTELLPECSYSNLSKYLVCNYPPPRLEGRAMLMRGIQELKERFC